MVMVTSLSAIWLPNAMETLSKITSAIAQHPLVGIRQQRAAVQIEQRDRPGIKAQASGFANTNDHFLTDAGLDLTMDGVQRHDLRRAQTFDGNDAAFRSG